MKLLQSILAKSLIWSIIALIISFPLALVPMVIIEFIIEDFEDFIVRIQGNATVLYLIFVVVCFLGLLVVPLLVAAVKHLFVKEEEEDK